MEFSTPRETSVFCNMNSTARIFDGYIKRATEMRTTQQGSRLDLKILIFADTHAQKLDTQSQNTHANLLC